MKTLVQINVSLNLGSTGRIAEGIAHVANRAGWKCYTIHGARYVGKSEYESYSVSSRMEELFHYAKSFLLDGQGLGSIRATKRLVAKLEKWSPDVIHLHVIHGSYVNYKILFEYIIRYNIPVVWTFHDCWSFTGHCVFFDQKGCERWITGCFDCPLKDSYPRSVLFDKSRRNYYYKKDLLSRINNYISIPVSEWLGCYVQKSFLGNRPIRVIHNGIDIDVFKPQKSHIRERLAIVSDKIMVLGVANVFGQRKGLSDFIELSKDPRFQIVLVGTSEKEKQSLPSNIIAISNTDNIQTLVELYSTADVFANPTYEDNFPTTNLEALACGTPVITYDTGGSPEAIDSETGCVVPKGDLCVFREAIISIVSKDQNKLRKACRNRAVSLFDKNKCFMEYLEVYNELLRSNDK